MTIHCTTVENLFKDSLKKVFRLILSKRRIVINNSYKQDKLFIEFFKKVGEKTTKSEHSGEKPEAGTLPPER